RTGDLVRQTAEGAVDFLGRVDRQVKLRGFRIELGEVETVLRSHPEVREALVLVSRSSSGDRRMVAYWIGEASVESEASAEKSDGAESSAGELRSWLAARMPAYMAPSVFLRLESWPLNSSGKIDRGALPAAEDALEEARQEYVAPRNASEERLAEIWRELLGLPEVGVTDDFFELGGHSLLATRLASRVRRAFEVDLPLAAVFEDSTVAGLSEKLVELQGAVEGFELPPLLPSGKSGPHPLSFAQLRLWLIDELDPGNPAYNVPAAMALTGELDARALERALGEILRRHDALRTVFRSGQGQPQQTVLPFTSWSLQRVDLEGLADSRGEALERIARAAAEPFDLAQGPLFRAVLYRLGPQNHLLALTLHHIVSDGWSVGVFSNELSTLYGDFLQGRESSLPALPVQYTDFARWQREWLQGEILERQISAWRDVLGVSPEPLDLPIDRPRPAVQSLRGASISTTLEADLAGALGALGQARGGTLFMTLMASLHMLMARACRQQKIILGTPIAGRRMMEVEPLVGFFVNMLPIAVDLGGGETAVQVLDRVRSATVGAFGRQDLPFEMLVDALETQRDPSRPSLVQVSFTFQNEVREELHLEGLEVSGVPAPLDAAKFELSFGVAEVDDRLEVGLSYASELFEEATVQRLLGHWEMLLRDLVAYPKKRFLELALLTPAERQQLLEWGQQREESDPRGGLHHRFETWAEVTPDAIALVTEVEGEQSALEGSISLTYQELDQRANAVAHRLVAAGVRTEALVGLYMERSMEMLVGLLGILKAGGAYVPLDPAYPADRLRYIVEDAGITTVVALEGVSGEITEAAATIVPVASGASESAADSAGGFLEPPRVSVRPDQLAYVIYTSGSTGQPKGVGVTHGNVDRLLSATESWFGFGPEDVWTLFHSFSFDFSVWEIWGSLAYGGRLVVVPYWTSRSPAAFASLLERHSVTVLNQTPSAFRQLLLEPEALGLEDLRWVIFGGEALELASLEPWFEAYGDSGPALINMYGITETTVHVTYRPILPEDLRARHRSPIGSSIADLSLHLVDPALQVVPVGVSGEILVGGAGLARGYLGRPALTAERFVPDALSGGSGTRLYRSGDLGRWRPAAELDFLGRADHQVKIRGFRIELGEVQAALLQQPGVAEAAVVASEDPSGNARLVAYVVTADETLEMAALRQSLVASLPDHLVPAAFVNLQQLPLTANGKLDRKALPLPEEVEQASTGDHAEPSTEAEHRLVRLWQKVLGVDEIGVEDDFFTLGGNSLVATQVVSGVREEFGLEMPLMLLFERPTVAALATFLEAQQPEDECGILPAILATGEPSPHPLSFAQQRLWFIDEMAPGNAAYNVPFAVGLVGALNYRALKDSLAEVVRRHEALRTTFHAGGEQPVQVVESMKPWALPVVDLSSLAEATAESRRLSVVEAMGSFDLRRGPLFRARLLRLGAEDHLLQLSLHHIVSDGWSIGVFARELSQLYGAFAEQRPSPLMELPVQYGDFARWQHRWLQGEVLDRQLAYWKDRIGDSPEPLELPFDRPRPAQQTFAGADRRFRLSRAVEERLAEAGEAQSRTLFMTLLAAFQMLLARLTGQPHIIVGSPIANRHRKEIEPLIGFFVNTLALSTDLSEDPVVSEVLERVRRETLEAFQRPDLPFERLVEALVPGRDPSRPALVQVSFTVHSTPREELQLPGLEAYGVEAEMAIAKFDLTVAMGQDREGMGGVFNYNTDLFDGSTMDRLIQSWEVLLEGVLSEPRSCISDLPLLTSSQQAQLLGEWNDTATAYPAEACIDQLFALQVRRDPEAIAILAGDRTWSYGELDRRSNQVARALVEVGVGPESMVGLCVERSPEMVAAVLGVAKAG
ncbi:MAG: amino acid adenylation domain-containing protein, partial [Deltaproteobacteria bacterium]|nr:amino acid adenylation domain-containing protein [Deltaproteobacteria bacterium]